jgi:hypothetical protein
MVATVFHSRMSSLPPRLRSLRTTRLFLLILLPLGFIQESLSSSSGDVGDLKESSPPPPPGFHLRDNAISEETWTTIQHWLETDVFINLPWNEDEEPSVLFSSPKNRRDGTCTDDSAAVSNLDGQRGLVEIQEEKQGDNQDSQPRRKSRMKIPWEIGAPNRRVAQFGFRYNYDSSRVEFSNDTPEIPLPLRRLLLESSSVLVDIREQLLQLQKVQQNENRDGIFDTDLLDPDSFTQCIINIYQAGDYIPWHWDHVDFGPTIVVFVFGDDDRPLQLRKKMSPSHPPPDKQQHLDRQDASSSSSQSFKILNHSSEGPFEYFTAYPRHRSCYILTGPVRYHWEHSVPVGVGFRVSITFRSSTGRPKTLEQSSDSEHIGKQVGPSCWPNEFLV